jgi:hypothetical protein
MGFIECKMCVLISSATFVWNIIALRRMQQSNVHTYSYEVPVIRVMLMKLAFSRQISEKYSNIKFHENPSNGSRVPNGQTYKANSHSSQFCERTKIWVIQRLEDVSPYQTS